MKEQYQHMERRGLKDWWESLFDDNSLEVNLGSHGFRRKGFTSQPMPAGAPAESTTDMKTDQRSDSSERECSA